jgi:hypothetical protein
LACLKLGPTCQISATKKRETHREDLVDQIFHTDDAVFAERLLNDLVRVDGQALLVGLGETALVHELLDRLEVGVAPGDVGPNPLQLHELEELLWHR